MKSHILILLLSLATLASAATVQILPAQGADFDASAPATIQALMRTSVLKAGDTPTDSAAPIQLRTSLMHLGQSYLVVSEKIENGQVTGSGQLKAANADELDIAVERTVLAALGNSNASATAEVGTLTAKDETEVLKRKESRNYKSFGLGPAFLHGLGSDNLAYMLHSGYIWEAGRLGAITLTNSLALDVIDFALHNTFLIGGRYHFTATAVSPFVGAGLGIGLAEGDAFRFGFATGASAGVIFFRTSSTQLETAIAYDVLFDSHDNGHAAGKTSAHIAINY